MNVNILIEPKDREIFETYFKDASEAIEKVEFEHRSHFDANDLLHVALLFRDGHSGLLVLGYLLGRNTRFYLDHKGLHIEIKRLEELIRFVKKVWRESKSHEKDVNEGKDESPEDLQ
jgi:hypothetical protein